jgi:hypothetical protein
MAKNRVAVLASGVACACGLFAPSARANGRFPFANQLVLDPADAKHLIVRTTYGVVESSDDGAGWRWICEGAVGYSGAEDPTFGILPSGTMLAGTSVGMAVSAGSACDWQFAAGDLADTTVVDLTVRDGSMGAVALAASYRDGGVDLFVATSGASGNVWSVAGTLPSAVAGQTIEVAPSDPSRFYVSLVTRSGAIVDVSRNGGASWTSVDANWGAPTSAWISAVDPTNADRLYVRLKDAQNDRLGSLDVSTGSWTPLFTSAGPTDLNAVAPHGLVAFALSPDGSHVAVGGYDDGLHLIDLDSGADTPMAAIHPLCLAWTAQALYACGFEPLDGFTVGRSPDEGKSFQPLYRLAGLCSPEGCLSTSSAGMQCPAAWSQVAAGGAGTACDAGGAGSPPASSSSRAEGAHGCGLVARRSGRFDGAALALTVSATLALRAARRRRSGRRQ